MKFIFYLLIFSSLQVFSQGELKRKPISGAGLNTTVQTPPANNKPSMFPPLQLPPIVKKDDKFFKSTPFEIGKKKEEIDLSNVPVFANPDQDLLDKLNKKNAPVSENFELIRGNQNFGSFSLNTNLVNIKCRDFGEVDDDEVRIYLNGRLVESRVILDSNFKNIDIPLQKGFNKIEIEAINQGTTGPNTAEFKIYDDAGKLIVANQWNLATGFKAVIVFTKE